MLIGTFLVCGFWRAPQYRTTGDDLYGVDAIDSANHAIQLIQCNRCSSCTTTKHAIYILFLADYVYMLNLQL